MIRSIAIDDEPVALKVIQSHAANIPDLDLIRVFSDPLQALNYLEENPVDLLFLDIDMPELNGLKLAGMLSEGIQLVFTTAHSEYALESYEFEATDYLLKPFDFKRFEKAVERARNRKPLQKADATSFLFVKTGKGKVRLNHSDIQWIEGDGNYVRYQLKEGHELVRASVRETLKTLPEELFIQVHRSYIVGIQWIDKIESNSIYIGGKQIPISSTYKTDLDSHLSS
ncbi:MAG: response regulator transcription factor [Bacteroidetes bacterium]|nr:response regulator transcription factor [Bacteroidota bacterium]